MAGFGDNANARRKAGTIETPAAAGYRNGMTAAGLIGRRLARVYGVAEDVPRDMGTVLRVLDAASGKR